MSQVAAGVRVTGLAAPGARVRLASPGGVAQFAAADASGRWAITLPSASGDRIFGLSMIDKGRQVQGQGYVLLTSQGRQVLLRSGAGAVVSGPNTPTRLTALDFDGEGGGVASGFAPPNTAVQLQSAGRVAGTGKSDATGRFSIALNQPLKGGSQSFEVSAGASRATAAVAVSPAAPVTQGAFRTTLSAAGARVDWLTPGGGLQSTLLLN